MDPPDVVQTPGLLDLQDLPPAGRDPHGRGGGLRPERCPRRQPGRGLSPGQAVPCSPLPWNTGHGGPELLKSIPT